MRRGAGVVALEDRPLRVLHIGPTPFLSDRGCHIRIRGLVRGLRRHEVESWLCTYGLGGDVADVETERIASIPGYRRLDAGPSVFKYVADIMLLAKVCGSILRRNPDVLHGHLHEGALIGHAARTLLFWRRLPLVFDMQGSLTGELEQYGYFRWFPPARWLFRATEWIIDRLPDRIAASSTSSLEIAQGKFGIEPQCLSLVPDGADVAPVSAERIAELRADLGLPTNKFIVVYSGSLKRVKGLDALHATIAGAAARGLPVHFLIVGYPVEPTRRFLCSEGLDPICSLAGRVPFDEISEYLALADMALEPKPAGSGEASGKMINYMAAALPVACFDTPNNRAMLADSGCYASPESAEELIDAIAELSADRERAAALGRYGLARAAAEFSWEASADTLLHLYYDCMGEV
jgi:glycosyltransferase involved in cell wall biosynthesis